MRRLWSPGWVVRHLATLVLVLGFLALGWWQFRRATGGNALSWGYTLEWPVFAGFVVFLWFHEVRRALTDAGDRPAAALPPAAEPARRPVRTSRPQPPSADDDPELLAYNDMLAWLREHPQARPADYPGPARGAERSAAPGSPQAKG
jgi:hypothetical protein